MHVEGIVHVGDRVYAYYPSPIPAAERQKLPHSVLGHVWWAKVFDLTPKGSGLWKTAKYAPNAFERITPHKLRLGGECYGNHSGAESWYASTPSHRQRLEGYGIRRCGSSYSPREWRVLIGTPISPTVLAHGPRGRCTCPPRSGTGPPSATSRGASTTPART